MLFPHHTTRLPRILVVVVVSLVSWHVRADEDKCQVWNAAGEDVTASLATDSHVLCEGSAVCQNYTISNCLAVKCVGSEACYLATLQNIGQLVECQQIHSCHRAIVHFAEPDNNNNNDNIGGDDSVQSMTCQGEGACNVAEIRGSRLQLECFGRKACRKINAVVDSVHCTHGDEYSEACTDYARIQANCVLCGYLGCESHVNHCATKTPREAPEDERFTACLPHQAIGSGCTASQILALKNEIDTEGQIMAAQEVEDIQKETINESNNNNNNNDDGGSK